MTCYGVYYRNSEGTGMALANSSGRLQCCVADPDPMPFLTPGSGIRDGYKIGIRIRDEQPGSYFRELRNHFLGIKYLNFLMRPRDPEWKKFGSGKEKIRIRDKHSGSTTLVAWIGLG
jgi:hypothetical protein